jgi:hypothetical protein
MHIKSIIDNSNAIFSLKTLHPGGGGIRTRRRRWFPMMSTAPCRQGILWIFIYFPSLFRWSIAAP